MYQGLSFLYDSKPLSVPIFGLWTSKPVGKYSNPTTGMAQNDAWPSAGAYQCLVRYGRLAVLRIVFLNPTAEIASG